MRLIDSVSLSLRLKDLLGPVMRVKKKKEEEEDDGQYEPVYGVWVS